MSSEAVTPTRTGTPDLEAALRGLAEVPTLLVASDFDGALAEFTTDPSDTGPAPGAMTALRALSRLPGTRVAIVSGRDVRTLTDLTGLRSADRIALIGSHGAESTVSGIVDGSIDAAQRSLLDELTTQVAALIEDHPGARLERKRAAVAVHTRGLAADSANAALAAADRLGQDQDHGEVRVLKGKSVVELSVSHADKGTSVRALATALGADNTFYSGDDVTDEDAFLALAPGQGDVTVKVGAGETNAAHRVPSVQALVATLQRLLELRRDLGPDRRA